MSRVARIQSRICGGGPALHSILLSDGLSYRRGSRYDTTLIGGALEPGESSMAAFAEASGVKVETIPEMGRAVRPANDAIALAKMVARLRALDPLIVHTHTAKAGAIGRTAARIVRTPVVVHTFHGHVFEGYFSSPAARAFVLAERALARISDAVLALSEQQRQDLAFKYAIAPIEKIHVVPLGLDLGRFAAVDRSDGGAFRASLGISADAPLVVAAGRMVPIKRFDVLLDAFARVLHELPTAHLAIAGDGAAEMRAKLEQQAAPLSPHVHFLGWRTDLDFIYRDADVLALTSDNEGTPVAVIEALSAGLPVVATRVGGVEDVVSPGCGTLVAPGRTVDLARALVAQLRERRSVGPELRGSILRRFSHHRLISDVSSLYDALVEEKLGRRATHSEAVTC